MHRCRWKVKLFSRCEAALRYGVRASVAKANWVMYCIVSSRPTVVAMHKRENFLCFVMVSATLAGLASVHGGSKVIGSSEQVHVVDALAMIGDEGRDSLR